MTANWHPDPTGAHELRYWDGSQWTEHVADAGVQSTSPLPGAQGAATTAQAETTQAADTSQYAQSTQYDTSQQYSGGQYDASQQYGSTQSAETAAAESVFAAESPATGDPYHQAATSESLESSPLDSTSTGSTPAEATPAEASPADSAPVAEATPAETTSVETPAVDAGADPFGAGPAPVAQAEPVQAQPVEQQPVQPQPVQPGPGPAGGAPQVDGGITGDLIDGRYSEVGGEGATLQNNRLLRVRVGQPFMARQGAMVAYQGNVQFAFQGGGVGKFLKKAVTGEGLSLMRVEGQGDVFLADTAKHVHILNLNNSGISVNGANVLAFASTLEWNVERVKGGSIAAGGLFNTTLRGSGWVAIVTDGEPVVLNAAEAPTFADTNAIVAWSASLQTSLKTSMSAGALVGRGSGEAIQVAFNGQGFVIVQPSEGYPIPTAT